MEAEIILTHLMAGLVGVGLTLIFTQKNFDIGYELGLKAAERKKRIDEKLSEL